MKTRLILSAVVLLALILLASCAKKAVRPIFDIAKDGTPQEMQAAIEKAKGANVNDIEYSAGETVLMYAAHFNKNPEVIAALLKASADMKAQDYDNQRTASMWAAQSTTNRDVITTLLKAGADIKQPQGRFYSSDDSRREQYEARSDHKTHKFWRKRQINRTYSQPSIGSMLVPRNQSCGRRR